VRAALEEHGLSAEFPQTVHEQVDALCEGRAGLDDASLLDLRAKPFITIDNDDSMDLDQAMCLERVPPSDGVAAGADPDPGPDAPLPRPPDDARFRVLYALADGAFFVAPKTPLFAEALRRGGSSFYLPGLCVPMLPRKLSEDQMSLNAQEDRRALVLDMWLKSDGSVARTDVYWALVRSRWKGSYRRVQEEYFDLNPPTYSLESPRPRAKRKGAAGSDAPDAAVVADRAARRRWILASAPGRAGKLAAEPWAETMHLLRIVGDLRRALARGRHVVEYNRERAGIAERGGRIVFELRKQYKSELYNEQISLLCNMEGAKKFLELEHGDGPARSAERNGGRGPRDGGDFLHAIYRSQPAPSERQVDTLETVIRRLVEAHGLPTSTWLWRRGSGEALGDYLRRLHRHCERGHAGEAQWAVLRGIDRQAMMTNVKATFAAENRGHHSIRAECYARFSSPMRELVGCFTHKEMRDVFEGRQTGGTTAAEDEAMRVQVIRAALKAKKTQKRLARSGAPLLLTPFAGHALCGPSRTRIVQVLPLSCRFARKTLSRSVVPSLRAVDPFRAGRADGVTRFARCALLSLDSALLLLTRSPLHAPSEFNSETSQNDLETP
jgi:ribonuclease R